MLAGVTLVGVHAISTPWSVAFYTALHFTEGIAMGKVMTTLAIFGVLAALYFANRYGVF